MNHQTFKTHKKFLLMWSIIMPLVLLALLVGSIINLVQADQSNLYSAALILVIVVFLFPVWWLSRRFSLKAQDRAIRAEENFRHFLLTGKPFDGGLRLGQIIALRFAADEEMPSLAQRALQEKLPPTQIKAAIRNWRADYYRV